MRTFTATVPATTTADQVKQMNATRIAQNNLAKSGGGTTVPQFRTSPTTNTAIQNMAAQQLKMDQNNTYNSCVGKPAGSCGGGRSISRSRTTRRRQKKSRTRRKKKMKY
jgi:hypothetical protein